MRNAAPRRAVLCADPAKPAARSQAGSVTLTVIVVTLIVAAAGVGALALARAQLVAAQRRVALAQLRWLGRAATAAVGAWFEAPERGALVAPPAAADMDRDRRQVDPDGDGAGTLWSRAPRPWNCRYKEAHPERLFRPPDGGGPEDSFLGVPEGPDLVLDAAHGARVLEQLSRALAPGLDFRVAETLCFKPPPSAGPAALATVEVILERTFPGAGAVRVRTRGEVLRVDWGRADRPLEVVHDALFLGEASWGRGEAVVGGDLLADPGVWERWPGGIPWLAPDQPLRDDADGDGTPDDADADGAPDLETWRSLPGLAPDPWWRARVGGRVVPPPASAAPCASLFPFGPRARPPAPPSKTSDRSGWFTLCPSLTSGATLDPAWLEIAAAGVRGAWRADEDPRSLGAFRLDGAGAGRALEAILPEMGGAALVTPAPGRAAPLQIALDGRRGAVLVSGGDAICTGGRPSPQLDAAPGDPRDARRFERAGQAGDDFAAVGPGGGCDGWDVGPWAADADGSSAALRHACGERDVHFAGLIAVPGVLRLEGPLTVLGQVRAGALTADGAWGAVSVLATASSPQEGWDRPGPPGAPRVIVVNRRTVR